MTLHPDLVDLLKLVAKTIPRRWQQAEISTLYGGHNRKTDYGPAKKRLLARRLIYARQKAFDDLGLMHEVVLAPTDAGYSLLLSLVQPDQDWRPSESLPEDFYAM